MSNTTTPEPRTVRDYGAEVGHKAHPYQSDERIKIKVDVAPRQQMIGEALVEQGLAILDIPASALPAVQSMLIDQAKAEVAREQYQSLRDEWAKANPGMDPDLSPHSIPGSYTMLFRKDMGCLHSLEILEEGIPAPMTAEEKRAASVAANVAATLAAAASSGDKQRRGRPTKD